GKTPPYSPAGGALPDAPLGPPGSSPAIPHQHCWAPFRRLSIRADGSTNVCLDIADGSFGDVRASTPQAILASERAARFRAAITRLENPACRRCAWRWHGPDYRKAGP
ncbi:MAG: SPASM domain-containing protein, partial [Planctomycetes bacterium]|nr:SPASM domain-containing protein [Planctomycetota bacterium]